ncbi:MAG: ribosome recycling factor [Saprospiraceae bacterium]|jgi:ribosome recycling factor
MIEEINEYFKEAINHMDEAMHHLNEELLKIRTGKASPAMLKGILVDYYDNPTPLAQVANLGTADAKTLTIQPWEKKMIAPIERAIFAANLGLTPQNDGELIRINIPPLTEDRRKEMVKVAKAVGEDAKVSLRSTRHKLMDFIKKAVKDGFPEDGGKRKEDEIQKLMDKYGAEVDSTVKSKETDIMTV